MMTREEARQRALRRAVRKRKGRSGPTDSAPTRLEKIQLERPTMTIGQMQRLKERKLRERRLREQSMQARPGMLTGGQAKLDKNKNNKIDAQDFKILRAEKEGARGRGKVTKAALGVLAAGLSAKKRMKNKKMAPVGMGAIGAGTAKLDAIKKILGKNKGGMGEAKGYKKYLKGLEAVTTKAKTNLGNIRLKGEPFLERRINAAKATRIGKIAAGVAGAALLGKAALEKMYEKRTGKKPFTKRPDKKMGGGMMMRRPMIAKKGKMVKAALGVMALGLANKKKMQKAKKMMKDNSMGVTSAPFGVGVAMAKNRKIKEILGVNKGGMIDYYKDLI